MIFFSSSIKKAIIKLSTLASSTPQLDVTTPVVDNTFETPKVQTNESKKRGRKKGYKVDLMGIVDLGGKGGWSLQTSPKESVWELNPRKLDWDDSDTTSYGSSQDSSNKSNLEDFEFDEMEDNCITNMTGTWILPVKKLATIIKTQFCCKKCAVAEQKEKIT